MDLDDNYDDNDDEGLLKKALDVNLPKDFDPDKLPETGVEYVQRVMYERTQCQEWVRVDVNKSKIKEQTVKIEAQSIVKEAPTAMLPTFEWQTKTIKDFTNFRKYIHSKIHSDVSSNITSFDEDKFILKYRSTTPLFSEIIRYSQLAKVRMLQIISNNLTSEQDGLKISPLTGSWIYGILTLLELPLNPDWCFTVREFGKKCLSIRAALDETASEADYKPLNFFICIVARFYRQLDLADP